MKKPMSGKGYVNWSDRKRKTMPNTQKKVGDMRISVWCGESERDMRGDLRGKWVVRSKGKFKQS